MPDTLLVGTRKGLFFRGADGRPVAGDPHRVPRRQRVDGGFRRRSQLAGEIGGDARPAFGSPTGSLWVSVDEGDSWAAVAEHLPPVYVARWAEGLKD